MEVAQQNTFNAIQQYGKPVVIVSQNSTNSRGGMNALKTQGMLVPNTEPGHVFIATIGGAPAFLDLIREGIADRGFVQPNMFYGPIALELLRIIIEEGEDALPPIGSVMTADDLKVSGAACMTVLMPGRHLSGLLRMWVESFGHRWLKVKGLMVTHENLEDPRLWGNAAKKWL